ncbi:SPOSA6832_00625 [Sporobolomyces salmonicolor]|uniref:Glutamine synthetase n=1 Tax=Sporidiobolus salmonicolor TaxID=5005 RepID=A0A0D6EGM8_SPOSA|nr:SPOSA6832_00625 [Sporobolomyces salmonicolor]
MSEARNPHSAHPDLLQKYMELPQGDKIQAEYVWVDADGGLRCKTTTLSGPVKSLDDLKEWNFDGSSTGQAEGANSDVFLRPAAYFPDPFRRGNNIIVMAETCASRWRDEVVCLERRAYSSGARFWGRPDNNDGTPNKYNHRYSCMKTMEAAAKSDPWFGLEQEYTIFGSDGRPYGWPVGGFPGPQGPYYCGVALLRLVARAKAALCASFCSPCAGYKEISSDSPIPLQVFARDMIEAHYRACMYAGVNISGINAEVMPSQWEFQVGPCKGKDMGDHLWMARYLLIRIAEEWGVTVSFHPKPLQGDWNGAGCHTNYSTNETRAEGGIKAIEEMIKKLEKRHLQHIEVYGSEYVLPPFPHVAPVSSLPTSTFVLFTPSLMPPPNSCSNDLRLTGRHETGHIGSFSSGVANRGASIRIPKSVAVDGKGYFEDRRPASNIDPYQVCDIMVQVNAIQETTLLSA